MVHSKVKGNRGEREFAELTGGKRIPLSGSLAELPNDVRLPNGWAAEVKRREGMHKTLYEWVLDEREKPDVVAFRSNHKPWLVTMKIDKFLELLKVHTFLTQKGLLSEVLENGGVGHIEDAIRQALGGDALGDSEQDS